ncbi:MAG: regulatory protein [Patiriisocius sp.]|jgi:regulatory protein
MKELQNIANQNSTLFDDFKSIRDFEVEWNKVIYYCNYRERCVSEVKKKMNELELSNNVQEDFLLELGRLKMVDDERFAVHYAQSKFNIKHWGRNKIRQELSMKKITSSYINEALYAIDDDEYIAELDRLLDSKKSRTKGKSKQDLQMKLYRFVYYKGFESELIRERLNLLFK